jgi:hypothetical protein
MVYVYVNLALFFVIPVLILMNSKKRLGHFSWEWAVFSLIAWSTYSTLLNVVIFSPQRMQDGGSIVLFLRTLFLIGGAVLFYKVYLWCEQIIKEEGKKWVNIRKIVAIFILILMPLNLISHRVELIPEDIFGGLFLIGIVAFVITQIGMVKYREKAKE